MLCKGPARVAISHHLQKPKHSQAPYFFLSCLWHLVNGAVGPRTVEACGCREGLKPSVGLFLEFFVDIARVCSQNGPAIVVAVPIPCQTLLTLTNIGAG
jgi:hypothetical protein